MNDATSRRDPSNQTRVGFFGRGLISSLVLLQLIFGVPLIAPLGEARAQVPSPRVWLGPLQADDVPGARLLSEKFDEGTRRQLGKSQYVESTDQAGEGPVSAGEADPRVDQAESLRVAGKALFVAKKYVKATVQLKAALKLYEESLASLNTVDVIAETLGYLGAAAMAQEFDADAKDYFKRVVAMVPDGEPLDGYSPEAKKLYHKVKKRLLSKKKGSLSITTEPSGATIRVDGIDKGQAPVKVEGLLRGMHYIQASGSKGLAAVRTKARGNKTRQVNLSLSKVVGPEPQQTADAALVSEISALARKGALGEDFREKAEAIGIQTRADYVIIGNIAPKGNKFVLTAYIYGLEQKQVAAFDQFRFRADLSSVFVQAAAFSKAIEKAANNFPYDKVVVGGMVVASAPPQPPEPSRPLVPAEPEPVKDPLKIEPAPIKVRPMDRFEPAPTKVGDDDDDGGWYTSWWLWTVVGVAVIGGTAYGGYVLLQEEESNEFNAVVRW